MNKNKEFTIYINKQKLSEFTDHELAGELKKRLDNNLVEISTIQELMEMSGELIFKHPDLYKQTLAKMMDEINNKK